MEHLGVCILLFNKKGQLLLGKRKNGYGDGMYGIPGGRVEGKERLIECAKRELREETGVKVKALGYTGVIREFQKDYNFIHFGFVAKDIEENIENPEPDKCEGWEWFDIDSLPSDILPGHDGIIHLYQTGGVMAELV